MRAESSAARIKNRSSLRADRPQACRTAASPERASSAPGNGIASILDRLLGSPVARSTCANAFGSNELATLLDDDAWNVFAQAFTL